jgi:multidrug efflux pump subunit AcrA (membrane-fusion protein)
MPFQYGQTIQSGQLLFLLSSAKFLTDYKSSLMAYLKAKSDFNGSDSQLAEATFLHKHLLISDDDFKMKQANYYASRLALLQAKDTLESLLHQLDIKDVNVYNLTIADIDKITQALHLQLSSENLRILSPAAGVVLAAAKNEEESKKLVKGDVVKQGDVLAVIGDMSGVSVRIKVNELIINQLKVGQKIKVTGIAFPEHTLEGIVKRVDRQGEATNGGLPTFAVEVIVPKLTLEQQKRIHVGMSAKVEIDIEEEKQLLIPITAITERNGASFVSVFDKDAGKIIEKSVNTGKTTVDSVAILSGVNAGDRIVVPN